MRRPRQAAGQCHFRRTYVTGSIRMRSNIALHLDPGCVIEASAETSAYDAAESNPSDRFQDFGHSLGTTA